MSLPLGDGVHLADEVIGAFDRMTVHFEDNVAGGKAGIIGRAGGANILDGCAIHLRGNVELLSEDRE